MANTLICLSIVSLTADPGSTMISRLNRKRTADVMGGNSSIKIGILGAARVAPYALIEPARQITSVRVEAVASRSLMKAQTFARQHRIPKAFDSYEALIDDAIDAVYIALPPALHAKWTLRALERGKHVLCEKPLALNASLAREMARAARESNRVLQEGVHTLYSPVLRRQREFVRSGELGRVVHIASIFRHPNVPMLADDFRLQRDLGGGAALDLGCYAVAAFRYVAGEEPEVREVSFESVVTGVDSWMHARVTFPSGSTGLIECGFRGTYAAKFAVEVECERGWSRTTPTGLTYAREGQVMSETISSGNTYVRQLEAFVRQVRGESSDAPSVEDAIATACVVDAMYSRAGLVSPGTLAS